MFVRSPPTTTAGPGRRPDQPHGWYGASYTLAPGGAVFSSAGVPAVVNESRSSCSPVTGSWYGDTGGNGVGTLLRVGVRSKLRSESGTQREGDGARRRRFVLGCWGESRRPPP